jgi:hypothetical protein
MAEQNDFTDITKAISRRIIARLKARKYHYVCVSGLSCPRIDVSTAVSRMTIVVWSDEIICCDDISQRETKFIPYEAADPDFDPQDAINQLINIVKSYRRNAWYAKKRRV